MERCTSGIKNEEWNTLKFMNQEITTIIAILLNSMEIMDKKDWRKEIKILRSESCVNIVIFIFTAIIIIIIIINCF